MDLMIRQFCDWDIDFAVAQTIREGWDNTVSTFRVCLSHDPEGCFIAETDGQRVGMITTTRYVHSAWVGNLIVAPQYRCQRIGERLMKHAIGQLEARGIRTLWLEADPLGVNIYRRLGFVEQFKSSWFKKSPPHTATRSGTERLHASDLEVARTLDMLCFSDDRGKLLGEFLSVAHDAYCVRDDRRLVGFAMALPSATGVRLGPCVVSDPSAAGQLVDSVLSNFPDKTVVMGVPGVNRTATQLAESRGFARRLSSIRMLRGKAGAANATHRIVALANGAMG